MRLRHTTTRQKKKTTESSINPLGINPLQYSVGIMILRESERATISFRSAVINSTIAYWLHFIFIFLLGWVFFSASASTIIIAWTAPATDGGHFIFLPAPTPSPLMDTSLLVTDFHVLLSFYINIGSVWCGCYALLFLYIQWCELPQNCGYWPRLMADGCLLFIFMGCCYWNEFKFVQFIFFVDVVVSASYVYGYLERVTGRGAPFLRDEILLWDGTK